ncbi:DUF1800 domain-containing protein [Danxiaibacter flavus]|uniref:DUF1800 domain-containing protein n=1 Tax=Danxiaibacter flavus TaxID=3049108 RepID=A0ABV3ZG71_9BACT|nr:DUF1800 domain-containing protein [Chitinophagaceae bacterium DXS]
MVLTTQIKNQHLLWRAGFGVAVNDISRLSTIPPNNLYQIIEKKSQAKPSYFDVADNSLKGLFMGIGNAVQLENQMKEMSKEQKKQVRVQSREDIKSLNLTWLHEMVNSDAQLREKMSLFWHGHFACINLNIFYQQQLLNEIRSNALGNFGDLLRAVSKSAAMLSFLNNQQNKKQHPNENFAREVMELFTLGRGHYTEQDVKEAARAFTGWGFKMNGEFVFRKMFHDDGVKTVLGKAGNFDGDDVIDILLQQKQTALFITRKIYRYLVNDSPDEEKVKHLAEHFYKSYYNISSLMKNIFTADWFYDEKNVGSRVKSPVELIAGIRRTLPMQFQNESMQLLLQRVLGQLLFYPPNVAGWPGGTNWIDSSSLMLRLSLARLIKEDESFNIKPKTDDDQQMGMQENYSQLKATPSQSAKSGAARPGLRINADIDWPSYMKQFESVGREYLYDVMESVLLQTPPSSLNETVVQGIVDKSSREAYIQTTTIALMSTPEYQLC